MFQLKSQGKRRPDAAFRLNKETKSDRFIFLAVAVWAKYKGDHWHLPYYPFGKSVGYDVIDLVSGRISSSNPIFMTSHFHVSVLLSHIYRLKN